MKLHRDTAGGIGQRQADLLLAPRGRRTPDMLHDTNAASGISVELHHPASGESATPAFIEAELKKIVQIVDGYEAAEDTHIVE